ncbi:MAG: glycosyltransferase family 4 protein [Oscillospiraceae bacterium]|nr:glycosyltransferase family 4 protein [Oscillospiraceae bacterium]
MEKRKEKRILFVATVSRHFYHFHQETFAALSAEGWEVHCTALQDSPLPAHAAFFALPFTRRPVSKGNLIAFFGLYRLLKAGGYAAVHCHTPMGGILGRLAALTLRKAYRPTVLYTAHGFHFYKGAPLSGWLVYYPIERIFSRFTDILLTINNEDYRVAKQRLKAKHTIHINGVGCDTGRFCRAAESVTPTIIYTAELNRNKNQRLLIEAMPMVLAQYPTARLLLVGEDNLEGAYQRLAAEVGAAGSVAFLGKRDDIPQLLSTAWVYAASSLREGLPVNVMEAMAAGLPVAALDNRGHRELVADGHTGFLVLEKNAERFAQVLLTLLGDAALRQSFGSRGTARVRNLYSKETVQAQLLPVYHAITEKGGAPK